MIIKLPNADFSANNIGKVDIRTASNAQTQALLDYYGKTWTLPQQLAIEDFLTGYNALSFKSKIKKLVIPILAPIQTSMPREVQPKAFYDVVNGVILTTTYGGAYTAVNRQISANGFYDNGSRTSDANNAFYINLGIPTSWQSTHLGAYYHKTINESNKIIMSDASYGIWLKSNNVIINNNTTPDPTANYDPNSITTRGLRIFSYNGTIITGLAANLPFASTSNSGNAIQTTGAFVPFLLTRFDVMNDTTLGLISFGDALTQNETVEYNTLIDKLMNVLWTT